MAAQLPAQSSLSMQNIVAGVLKDPLPVFNNPLQRLVSDPHSCIPTLILGSHIVKWTERGVGYQTSAFCAFLLGPHIT